MKHRDVSISYALKVRYAGTAFIQDEPKCPVCHQTDHIFTAGIRGIQGSLPIRLTNVPIIRLTNVPVKGFRPFKQRVGTGALCPKRYVQRWDCDLCNTSFTTPEQSHIVLTEGDHSRRGFIRL